ncbi:MAG: EAL domain-containing protein [Gammaproteobacteria bacterium]|nr:EAL domain-containing protein [Gammaproteobacteria bacterium]
MFKLNRYFSITSLIGIVVAVFILSVFFNQLALQTLMENQTRANTDLTHSFANAVWRQFDTFFVASSSITAEQLKHRSELDQLQRITRQQMLNTNIVKVKIYNLNGLTVFSTDRKQIGKDKSKNQGFLQARSGTVASEITFRNEFYAFEDIIVDRNLISSYIPIHDKNNIVKAVFEVYSDVTPLVDHMETTQYKIILGVLVALGVLYIFLFLIIRRADLILRLQAHERQESEEKMRYQAYHDSLTGLPNRHAFTERIEEAIKRAVRHDKCGALLFLDLDRFKLVNDSLGHDAGDTLLKIVAKRILSTMRETDLVFRLSGDEFVIILEDLKVADCASIIARRVLDEMAKPILLNDFEVIINISIGITVFPKDDSKDQSNADSLLKEADVAMYLAKETNQNHFEFYVKEMDTRFNERLQLETDLQHALQNNQFILYYQTKVNAESLQTCSLEALIRWHHPDKGILSPDLFIPLLEDIGLIYDVGSWVLISACQQLQQWIDAGVAPLRISVNVSAKQFRNPNLLETVKSALTLSGLKPELLELELTETMFVDNTEHAIEIMHQLKKLGVSLSIDDFGSGYSSLSYLKLFPVDYLKIDRSFIKDLNTDHKDAAITTTIIALAKSLNLGLIAEGVENEFQMQFLRDQKCDELQGYLFSQPESAEALTDSLIALTPGQQLSV